MRGMHRLYYTITYNIIERIDCIDCVYYSFDTQVIYKVGSKLDYDFVLYYTGLSTFLPRVVQASMADRMLRVRQGQHTIELPLGVRHGLQRGMADIAVTGPAGSEGCPACDVLAGPIGGFRKTLTLFTEGLSVCQGEQRKGGQGRPGARLAGREQARVWNIWNLGLLAEEHLEYLWRMPNHHSQISPLTSFVSKMKTCALESNPHRERSALHCGFPPRPTSSPVETQPPQSAMEPRWRVISSGLIRHLWMPLPPPTSGLLSL
jgi:hypothetical protein